MRPRSWLALVCLALVPSALALAGCGGAGHSSSTSAVTVRGPLPPHDGDGDIDGVGMGPYDTDADASPTFGPAATPAEHAAVAALIKRYYAAAAGGDGALACTMLDPLVAEMAVEEHRPGKGPPALRGRGCAQVLSRLFAVRHRELIADVATLHVGWVQTKQWRAVALANFGPAREMLVYVRRANGVWQMNTLLDDGPL